MYLRTKTYVPTDRKHQNQGGNRLNWPTEKDVAKLERLPKETLYNLFFLHIKNLWRVDGLYFLGIEKRYNTEKATEIDANCWEIMGKIEARGLKKALNLQGNGVAELVYALESSSWALYQTEKESEATAKRGVFRVTRCRTQETRVSKGLSEFPCKQVRFGYLQSFAKEFNHNIEVVCKTCPPGSHSEDIWCEWEFILR